MLTLTSALSDILAAMNTCKQSAVTFEVFVLWLCDQHYYTHDVMGHLGIYPRYEGLKHAVNSYGYRYMKIVRRKYLTAW